MSNNSNKQPNSSKSNKRSGYPKSGQPNASRANKGRANKNRVNNAANAQVKKSVQPIGSANATVGKGKTVGILRGNKRGFAYLDTADGAPDLFIPHRDLKDAQHGDTVIVKSGKGDRAIVMEVLERGMTKLVGTYRADGGYVEPDSKNYYSRICISQKRRNNVKDNDKVVVEIVDYDNDRVNGKIIEVLGSANDVDSVILSAMRQYEFPTEFSAANIEQVNNLTECDAIGERVDYTKLMTITIDGDDSKDFDDAISVEKVGNGYILYVHIADVTHYVRQGSAIDKDALERATSVYLPNKVFPMLPNRLSNELCSLVEGQPRPTLTCVMKIDNNGNVTDSRIEESMICSAHRMTYGVVTKILEGDAQASKPYADIVDLLDNSKRLADLLRAKRNKRGNIDLVTKESKIVLDEQSKVVDISVYPYTISNAIIEEFMLAANETVAEFASKHELPFVYRVHERPDAEKAGVLRAFLNGLGIMLPSGDIKPQSLQDVTKQVQGTPIESIVNRVLLRSMQKAKYMPRCVGHFGLASQYYCHFTSPIRRYPDLQIHRILKEYLHSGDTKKVMKSRLNEVCNRSSEREVAAERVSRDMDDYYKAQYMQSRIGEQFSGYISGVSSFGIFVELANTCEGLVRMCDLPSDRYEYSESRYTIKGISHSFALGQSVEIIVESVDTMANKVNFKYVDPDGAAQ